MPWNDDSWRDSYDTWKLRSPNDDGEDYDYDRAEEDYCEHDDYNIDVLTGRAACNCCDYVWYPNSDEIDREIERQASYHEDCEQWNRQESRREFWCRLTYPIRWPIFRLLERIWPRKAIKVQTDDDIPF